MLDRAMMPKSLPFRQKASIVMDEPGSRQGNPSTSCQIQARAVRSLMAEKPVPPESRWRTKSEYDTGPQLASRYLPAASAGSKAIARRKAALFHS